MANTPDSVLYARITLIDANVLPRDGNPGGPRERPRYDSPERRREAFWKDVSDLSGTEVEPYEGEVRIQVELGRLLATRFVDRVHVDSPLKGRIDYRSLEFRVTVIDYGSAICKIEFPGLDTVKKIVDDNYDLFMFLTQSDVNTGFEQTFALPAGSVKTEVQGTDALKSAFRDEALPDAGDGGAGAGVPPAGAGGGGGANDPLTPGEKRLQRIIKGTLVIVLLVLIGTAWLLAYAWTQEREAQQQERTHIAAERKALLDLAASEVKIVSDRDVELAKAVAQGGASEVIALVHGYGTLAHDAATGGCCCTGCCPATSTKKKPSALPQCK
ncbi:hypothetical protein BN2476_1450006 [Paraburkholderia piptadeniae]|uniref:Uncharacterized protein n=1 Tax=Paraburkholderia piptadeniae TaxID=1701573 RepID=A0A1N7SWG3_9BURK|nr:hypothetical protein [Paraburkholderia piptadeniae]SIT51825.1 hypothetical protein BN2476_1450006 [Paraburkholderia piptadeniae]